MNSDIQFAAGQPAPWKKKDIFKMVSDSISEQSKYKDPYIRCCNCFSAEFSGGYAPNDTVTCYCESWGHDMSTPFCIDYHSADICLPNWDEIKVIFDAINRACDEHDES